MPGVMPARIRATFFFTLALSALLLAGLACERVAPEGQVSPPQASAPGAPLVLMEPTRTPFPFLPPTRIPGEPVVSPTPDAPHPVPTLRSENEQYIVQVGDSLGRIAIRYGISLQQLIDVNQITNPDVIDVGILLEIPAPSPEYDAPDFKIIPDSELVYAPYSTHFDVKAFVKEHSGYLENYSEEVDEVETKGFEIVQRVANEYSVNPRLLLAVLEYQSGWLRKANPNERTLEYPLGVYDTWRSGLYLQLAYAANELNRGYYLWRASALPAYILADGSVVPVSARINAGTAGVQNLFSRLYGLGGWKEAVQEDGLYATYLELFGFPFDLAYEPLLPPGLEQPQMQLPFEEGQSWSFTGGPHGGWADGSAWAALDFAPPGEALGCVVSSEWVVAIADGLIVRSENGAVVQDLDGDGFEQSGWTVLYMHIESRGRVEVGQYVRAGERIGHPSCEGGFSTGTHLHLARRYNGEWIPADGDLPFVMDQWVSSGVGIEYDGYLTRNARTITAWNGRSPENQISR